jgi:hypothetical protein
MYGFRDDSTPSRGTIGYAWGFEYFTYDGAVYRADYSNPLDTNGYRQGARFECYGTLPDHILSQLSDSDGNALNER